MMDTTTKDFLLQLKDILQDWKKIEHSEEYIRQLHQIGITVEQEQQISAGFLPLAELIYYIGKELDKLDGYKEQNYTAYIENKERLTIFKSCLSTLLNHILEIINQMNLQGNGKAQILLGVMHKYGIGTIKDEEKAVEFLEGSVNDDSFFGYFILAEFYHEKNIYQKEIFWLQKYLSIKNDALAQYWLGMCLYEGKGIDVDLNNAFKWLKKSAEQGNRYAANYLGECYYLGNGISVNKKEAVKWLKLAADTVPVAGYWLGDAYFYGNGVEKDTPKAFYWWQKSADKGDSSAQATLGQHYLLGNEVKQNDKEALKWLTASANQEDFNGLFWLGFYYFRGSDNRESDYTSAIKWFKKAFNQSKKAFNQGDDWASIYIGHCYYYSFNYAEAFKWYKKAAENGLSEGKARLGECYIHGNGIEKNQSEGIKWINDAVKDGNSFAEFLLAMCYIDGSIGEKNVEKALYWIKKSVEKDNIDGKGLLGLCYCTGVGVEKNNKKGLDFLVESAVRGSSFGAASLAVYLIEGWNGRPNYAEAIKWLKKAIAKGEADAELLLGIRYINGEGVPKDIEEGKKWIQRAKNHGAEDAQETLDKINNSSSSSDCFITTATCVSLGKPDDCYELNTFRNFRDSWLLKRFYGRLGFKLYYWLAPKMVAHINTLPNASAIYRQTWEQYLKPCLHLLEQKKYYKAMGLYITMAIRLKVKF